MLTVLGAGPLLDLNSAALSPKFQSFRLVDANPLVVPNWSRLNKPVEPVIADITNCMAEWCDKLRRSRKSWNDTLQLIRDFGANPVQAYNAPSDGLISLNILSQLEVGWQEMAEPALEKRFGKSFVRQHEQEWLDAIRPSSRMLVEQHLAAIERCRAVHALLICDLEYVEYTGRTYKHTQHEAPPMEWADGKWAAGAGIHFELIPALESVWLDQESFARWMPSYRLDWHDSWLWHIAPNGTEESDYGQLHRVGAFALSLQDH